MSHLDYLIRQDVEHGTFSPRNIFNDGFLTPQFYTYAKQLEEQIEKMKCCENCRYYAGADFICNVVRATKYGATKDKNGEDCNNLDKWELAE